MSLDFELIISGLIVTALKSDNPRPPEPKAVDLICPKDGMHSARLAYFPLDVTPQIEPAMLVDPLGERSGSIALDDYLLLQIVATGNPTQDFTLKWGPEEAKKPNDQEESEWMNWVATLDELGFGKFAVPPSGLPVGAGARITLPPGELLSINIIRDAETEKIIEWQFPATGDTLQKALANDLLFRMQGIERLEVKSNGRLLLSTSSSFDGHSPVRMCISNDTRLVPKNFGGAADLEHLEHMDALAPVQKDKFPSGEFEPPHVPINEPDQRTGDPICNGAIFVYRG